MPKSWHRPDAFYSVFFASHRSSEARPLHKSQRIGQFKKAKRQTNYPTIRNRLKANTWVSTSHRIHQPDQRATLYSTSDKDTRYTRKLSETPAQASAKRPNRSREASAQDQTVSLNRLGSYVRQIPCREQPCFQGANLILVHILCSIGCQIPCRGMRRRWVSVRLRREAQVVEHTGQNRLQPGTPGVRRPTGDDRD